MPRVTLYSRPGCHLCEIALATLSAAQAQHPFELEIRDIDDDPNDFERFRYEIPVVEVDGREVARHRVALEVVVEALKAQG